MRVIGGKAKGHRLKVPRGRDVRPTAARVKEAIFNILPHNLSGYRVLDLFAGTGNLSVEALSRGAAEAVLVDISHKAEKAIRDNLEASRFSGSARVWAAPVFRSLRLLSRNGQRFDLIFLDPPYEKGWIRKIVSMIAQQGLLEEKGILVAEHSVREPVEEHYGLLALKDQRRYGTTLLSFFGYDQSPPFAPRRDE